MAKGMNIFNTVPIKKVPRAVFDLSHTRTQSMKMGYVIPTFWEEVLPGDKFTLSSVNLLRMAPMISPVMHRVRVKTRYFFVPNRILWPEWRQFITAADGAPEAPYVRLTVESIAKGSIANYLGLPVGNFTASTGLRVTAFPFAAYRLIWDQYYRSQQLQNEEFTPLIAGDNTATYVQEFEADGQLRVGWEHDYFTACLPNTQAGDPVSLPLTFQNGIPVYLDLNGATVLSRTGFFKNEDGSPPGAGNVTTAASGPPPVGTPGAVSINSEFSAYDPNGTLKVDVNSAAATINDLRLAFRLQEWYELLARGGQRYTEVLAAHFNVKSSDGRMQRPEYIGGFSQNVVMSEVLSTSQSSNDGATSEVFVGSLAGHGISAAGGNTFTYEAEEHGILMCLVNIVPDTGYFQGIGRQWFRSNRLDYAWPTFANIGEQEVFKWELYADDPNGDDVFGYIPRYAEYKFRNNSVAGDFSDNLDFWHMARKFSGPQSLNAQFIQANPTDRIFAVTDPDIDKVYCQFVHKIMAYRPLPKFGIPTI